MYVCIDHPRCINGPLDAQGDGGCGYHRGDPHFRGEEFSERSVGSAHRAVRGTAAVGALDEGYYRGD